MGEYDQLLAISTFIMALAAVVALILDNRRTRFLHAVDMIVKIDDHFHDTDMRKHRRLAATALLDKTNAHPTQAIIVLDFFEKVGCLTRYGVLDKRMVWHEMYHWIHRYYLAASNYIKTIRKNQKDDTLWEDLEYLHNELVAIERKERRCTDAVVELTDDEIKSFLLSESQL